MEWLLSDMWQGLDRNNKQSEIVQIWLSKGWECACNFFAWIFVNTQYLQIYSNKIELVNVDIITHHQARIMIGWGAFQVFSYYKKFYSFPQPSRTLPTPFPHPSQLLGLLSEPKKVSNKMCHIQEYVNYRMRRSSSAPVCPMSTCSWLGLGGLLVMSRYE